MKILSETDRVSKNPSDWYAYPDIGLWDEKGEKTCGIYLFSSDILNRTIKRMRSVKTA